MSSKNLNNTEFKKKFLSESFNSLFVLEFTKHLIFNAAPLEVLKLKERILEERSRPPEEENLKVIVHEALNPVEIKSLPKPRLSFAERTVVPRSFQGARLFIPKVALPQNLSYLKPTATDQNIDLGKLNPLLNDPMVKTIECLGEGQNVIVRGVMGQKKTPITLEEDEIKDIINKFSEESKIPVHEGTFKVAAGKFVIMAIYSEVIGSKFIIQKIASFQRY